MLYGLLWNTPHNHQTTDHLTSHLGPQLLVWDGGGGGQGEGDQERGEAEAGAHLRAEDRDWSATAAASLLYRDQPSLQQHPAIKSNQADLELYLPKQQIYTEWNFFPFFIRNNFDFEWKYF